MEDDYPSGEFERQLEEFLVDYVDGVMDPAVRAAFEEYLARHPDVAERAQCMCQVREVLTRLGQHPPAGAPPGFQHRLRHRLACEMCPQPAGLAAPSVTKQHVVVTCAALLVVLLAAAVVQTTEPLPPEEATVATSEPTSPSRQVQRLLHPMPVFMGSGLHPQLNVRPRQSVPGWLLEDSTQSRAVPLGRTPAP